MMTFLSMPNFQIRALNLFQYILQSEKYGYMEKSFVNNGNHILIFPWWLEN